MFAYYHTRHGHARIYTHNIMYNNNNNLYYIIAYATCVCVRECAHNIVRRDSLRYCVLTVYNNIYLYNILLLQVGNARMQTAVRRIYIRIHLSACLPTYMCTRRAYLTM